MVARFGVFGFRRRLVERFLMGAVNVRLLFGALAGGPGHLGVDPLLALRLLRRKLGGSRVTLRLILRRLRLQLLIGLRLLARRRFLLCWWLPARRCS